MSLTSVDFPEPETPVMDTKPTTQNAAISFEVANGDTRFLGDLYQDLSEKARKKYALLQTPVFVEEFILDRTLTPAIETFGLEKVRLIDPLEIRLKRRRSNAKICLADHALRASWLQEIVSLDPQRLSQVTDGPASTFRASCRAKCFALDARVNRTGALRARVQERF